MGRSGQQRLNRRELVEVHGFETKYAMDALRLGYQGLELLEAALERAFGSPERRPVNAFLVDA